MIEKKRESIPVAGVSAGRRDTLPATAPALFLDQYYPFHYEVGFTIEREMRDPRLTQHQSVMLWIIHATVGDSGRMLRKDLEWQLRLWFDLTSSAISKALRGLAKPSLAVLLIEENPASAREKYVSLTGEGRQIVAQMKARGEAIVQRIVVKMSEQEIEQGLHFLRQVSAIVKNFPSRNVPGQLTGDHDDPD